MICPIKAVIFNHINQLYVTKFRLNNEQLYLPAAHYAAVVGAMVAVSFAAPEVGENPAAGLGQLWSEIISE